MNNGGKITIAQVKGKYELRSSDGWRSEGAKWITAKFPWH